MAAGLRVKAIEVGPTDLAVQLSLFRERQCAASPALIDRSGEEFCRFVPRVVRKCQLARAPSEQHQVMGVGQVSRTKEMAGDLIYACVIELTALSEPLRNAEVQSLSLPTNDARVQNLPN